MSENSLSEWSFDCIKDHLDLDSLWKHTRQNVVGELSYLGVKSLQCGILLGLEAGKGLGELGINLGLGSSELVGSLSGDSRLGISNLLLGGGTGIGNDLLSLLLEVGDLSRVTLDGGKLLAELLVTVIKEGSDWAEPGLVKEHHEEQELSSHDWKGQVEVENLTSLSVGSQGHDGVGQHSQGGWLDVSTQTLKTSINILYSISDQWHQHPSHCQLERSTALALVGHVR